MRARTAAGRAALSWPRMADAPRVGSSRPRIMRMVVVLPAPLRPMKAKTLPRHAERQAIDDAPAAEVPRQPLCLDRCVARGVVRNRPRKSCFYSGRFGLQVQVGELLVHG